MVLEEVPGVAGASGVRGECAVRYECDEFGTAFTWSMLGVFRLV